jgi:hypothetical protein
LALRHLTVVFLVLKQAGRRRVNWKIAVEFSQLNTVELDSEEKSNEVKKKR